MPTLEEKIDLIKDDVKEIKQVLKGYDGNPGLLKVVENNRKSINRIWLVLAASAGLGGSGFGIIKLLGG